MSLSIHPEAERLQKENAILLGGLASLVTERHELEHVVKPHLLALYQSKLGPWELRLLRLRCEVARLKRKTEMIQASLNCGEQPDVMRVDEALDAEFTAWQQKITEAAQKIETAQFQMDHLVSAEDSDELKALYRSLVKKLHPDLTPSLTDDQQLIWQRVQTAYDRYDLEELRALSLLAEHAPASAPPMDAVEEWQAAHEWLRARTTAMLATLAALKMQPPFCHRAHWEDEAWIATRREEIEAELNQIKPQAEALAEHLDSLIHHHVPGTKLGLN